MSIRKLDSGGYEVRYDAYDASGNRCQHKKRFKAGEYKAAQSFDAEHRLDRKEESKITIKEFFDGWLEHIKQHRKPLTYANYKMCIEKFVYSALEANKEKWKIDPVKFRLAKLKKSHVQGIIDWMIGEGYAASSVAALRRVLSSAFSHAMDKDDPILEHNPVKRTISGGADSKPFTALNADQARQLLDYLKGTHHNFYINAFLALTMGLCRAEVSGLKWPEINFDAKTLRVWTTRNYSVYEGTYESTPKTKKRRRTLPMPEFVAQELKDEKRRQLENQLLFGDKYAKSDYVCRWRDGRVYGLSAYNIAAHAICKNAGVPDQTFHSFRHSCASLLHAAGVPLVVISEILGHSSVRVTEETYINLFVDGKSQAAAAMDQVLGQKQECVKNVSTAGKNAHKTSK